MPPHVTSQVNPWSFNHPAHEARELFLMVERGACTEVEIRDLISIPPKFRKEFMACSDPAIAAHLEGAVEYRDQVMAHFEQLIEGSKNKLMN